MPKGKKQAPLGGKSESDPIDVWEKGEKDLKKKKKPKL